MRQGWPAPPVHELSPDLADAIEFLLLKVGTEARGTDFERATREIHEQMARDLAGG